MIHVSTFQDLRAGKIDAMLRSPEQLLAIFKDPLTASSKSGLRLLSLNRYGDLRTEKGALRHDANVLGVGGLVGDYDGGVVSIDEAADMLRSAGVGAMLYTSPSSSESAPRWRVVAPLSTEVEADEHLDLMGKLNAALGGILAPESFTLSQAYYYGRANDAAHYEVRDTLGAPNWADQIVIAPMLPAVRSAAPVLAHEALDPDARLRTGEGRREALKSYIASLSARGLQKHEIKALVLAFVARHFDPSDQIDESNIDALIDWVCGRDAANRVDVSRSVVIDDSEIAPLDLQHIATVEAPGRQWIWDDWIPRGSVTSLYGAGGVGKSLISLQLAVAVSSGRLLFGRQTTPGKVLCLYCEDDAAELHLRMRRMTEQMQVDLLECEGLQVDARAGKSNVLIEADDAAAQIKFGRLFGRLDEMLSAGGYALVVLDNIAQMMAVNENKRPVVTQAVNALSLLAIRHKVAILLLGHPSKMTGSQFSGSTAWDAAVRSRLMFERNEHHDDTLILRKAKANYSQLDEMHLRYQAGAYIRIDGLHADPEEIERRNINKRAAERAVIQAIEQLRAKNYDEWPTSSKTSPRYLPKLMQRHKLDFKISKSDIEYALDGLINLGRVQPTTEVKHGADRKKFFSLKVVGDNRSPFQG